MRMREILDQQHRPGRRQRTDGRTLRSSHPLRALTAPVLAAVLLAGCGGGDAAEQAVPTVGPGAAVPAASVPAPVDSAPAPSGSDAPAAELPPEEQPFTRIEGGIPDDLVASGLLLADYVPTYGEFGPVYGDGAFSVVQGTLPGELMATYGTCREVSVAAGWEVYNEYEFGDNMGFMARRGGDELHYMFQRSADGGLDVRVEIVLF